MVLKDVEDELKVFEDSYLLVIQCDSLEMQMKEQDLSDNYSMLFSYS